MSRDECQRHHNWFCSLESPRHRRLRNTGCISKGGRNSSVRIRQVDHSETVPIPENRVGENTALTGGQRSFEASDVRGLERGRIADMGMDGEMARQ